jgi:hypothetical protein
MKLSDRVDRLEVAVEKHFEESGEIRADLKWLKKSFFILGSLILTAIVERFFHG